MTLTLWMLAAYLAGSIPFGLLIGRARGIDIRHHGSKNIGATNVGRVLGRPLGLLCFALDLAKGLTPVLLYCTLGPGVAPGSGLLAALSGLAVAVAAMAGHILPIWLKFKGGKGVATGLGITLGLYPILTLPAVAVGLLWLATTWITGYVSLASVIASALLPPLALVSSLVQGGTPAEAATYTTITTALAAMIIIRHRANLQRLRQGTEARVKWARTK
ncbi:MAG: glycerol-3-phosphate 1-O-acyltransferase PlsY [Phycisphaeraceae bacterium]